MTSDETPAGGADRLVGKPLATSSGNELWIFVGATFLSALLLFMIQPLFAKMVLPLLGGSPSVWAVALCFFQAALLGGYLYAHVLTTRLDLKTAGVVHLGFIALAFVALPISIPSGWQEPSVTNPYLWQLGLFAVAIGLPFVAIAANAPLLQAWFARTGHAQASDPYFMYAASNLGSLLALLGYPFVLEPVFGVRLLSLMWSGGFVLLWLAIALSYWQVREAGAARAVGAGHSGGQAAGVPTAAPTWLARAGWVGLAFVPSALLTAVTTHIATDVASAPLLWVLPLALYLLTYVLVFRAKALVPREVMLWLHLVALVVALFELAQTKDENWMVTAIAGIVAFFTSAMVAHRTLYESRPAAQHLTEFYLWMAGGGVLGGIFAGLIAPQIFSEVFEYPLLLALTMACRPGAVTSLFNVKDEWLKAWLVAAAGLLVYLLLPGFAKSHGFFFWGWGSTAALAALFGVAALALYRWPARQLASVALIALTVVTLPSLVKRGDAQRSFFGVYRVMTTDDEKYKILLHGTTLHGAQRIRDNSGALVLDLKPATYYHPDGPMGSIVRLATKRASDAGRVGRFGVVGLGTGSLGCMARPGQRWRYFEIDPLVVKIASREEDFSYLKHCPPSEGIKIGDARLTLAKEEDGLYDLLVIDAFSSDAVPVHLMTKEALELYARKLRPDGMVMLHISNRYLDLEAVVASTGKLVPELSGLIVSEESLIDSYDSLSTTVAVFTRDKDLATHISGMRHAYGMGESPLSGWTDDYSDILRPMLATVLK
ncbi:MAG: hypothetical protein RLZ98_1126 [Pseudomonadota bacterium]|jgi:hypothetical protein